MSAPARDSVSVVIPVRNGVRFLGEAIASALSQTHPPAEVLVVDGGSNDGTPEQAVACGARCVRRPGMGLAMARNEGAAAVSSAFIAFLDSDDVWFPEKLERQVGYLLADPQLGYVTARARVRLEPGAGYPPGWPKGKTKTTISGALGSTLVARPNALTKVGGFNPHMVRAADYDWLLRARDTGVVGEELPDVLVDYRIHGGNLSYERAAIDSELFDALRASLKRRVKKPAGGDGRADA